DSPVVPRQLPERLVAELLEELRRSLDVGERERHRARVEAAHAATVLDSRAIRTYPWNAVRCQVCNQENPPGARFCLACGVALAAEAQPQEERRIVSII